MLLLNCMYHYFIVVQIDLYWTTNAVIQLDFLCDCIQYTQYN